MSPAASQDRPDRSKAAIGRRMRQVRKALNLTQDKFARGAKTSQNAYAQYESGMRKPAVAVAARFCDAYGMTLDFIYLADPAGLPLRLVEAMRALPDDE